MQARPTFLCSYIASMALVKLSVYTISNSKNSLCDVTLNICSWSFMVIDHHSWLGGSVVERRSLTGELSLVCTRSAADG